MKLDPVFVDGLVHDLTVTSGIVARWRFKDAPDSELYDVLDKLIHLMSLVDVKLHERMIEPITEKGRKKP